jgi:hypothetical protein
MKPPRMIRRQLLYGTRLRPEHRVVPVGHGARPTYGTRVRRMLTRLYR